MKSSTQGDTGTSRNESRVLSGLRELRDSVPVLSEAESDALVHARAMRRAIYEFSASCVALSREGRAG